MSGSTACSCSYVAPTAQVQRAPHSTGNLQHSSRQHLGSSLRASARQQHQQQQHRRAARRGERGKWRVWSPPPPAAAADDARSDQACRFPPTAAAGGARGFAAVCSSSSAAAATDTLELTEDNVERVLDEVRRQLAAQGVGGMGRKVVRQDGMVRLTMGSVNQAQNGGAGAPLLSIFSSAPHRLTPTITHPLTPAPTGAPVPHGRRRQRRVCGD